MIFKTSAKHLLVLVFTMLVSSCGTNNSSLNNESQSQATTSTTSEEVVSTSDFISTTTSDEASESSSSEEAVMTRTTYTNAVFDQDFPDPAGVYDPLQKAWFLYGTGGQIIKSIDGVSWDRVGNAFAIAPMWGTPGAGLWAPEVQYIDGQYVMYYSLSTWGDPNPGIGVASAPRPQGPWTDHGKLFRSLEIGVNNSIDPGVFVAEDGRVFMVWGSMRGNYIVELTSDGLHLKDETLEAASQSKIRVAGLDTSIGWTVDTYEAAYVRYFDGYYYLFLSMGTCCEGSSSTYQVVVGRSQSPTGPYLDDQGRAMTARNVGKLVIARNDNFVGTGHNSVIDDVNGEPWFYYHAYHNDNPNRGRVLLMERMLFDDNGWPYVSGFTPSTTAKIGPYYYL